MPHATMFNTLQYAKRLKEVGFTEAQAEVQAEALAGLIEGELATKRDLKELETRLELKIETVKAETIRWVAGLLLAQAALIATLVKLL
ncbi:MAG: DUF1640 domain-containing protein [Thermodesulfobacteriota bacterium]